MGTFYSEYWMLLLMTSAGGGGGGGEDKWMNVWIAHYVFIIWSGDGCNLQTTTFRILIHQFLRLTFCFFFLSFHGSHLMLSPDSDHRSIPSSWSDDDYLNEWSRNRCLTGSRLNQMNWNGIIVMIHDSTLIKNHDRPELLKKCKF